MFDVSEHPTSLILTVIFYKPNKEIMGHWSNYFIELEEPEEALNHIRDDLDVEDGSINLHESGIVQISKRYTNITKEDFSKFSDIINRFLVVEGNDTSCCTTAKLYTLKDGEIEEIDRELSPWGDAFEGEILNKDLNEDYISGETYLRSYFYRKYGLKMWGGRSENVSEYENCYNPLEHQNTRHVCPVCMSKNIKVNGWDAKCRRCSYENSKPWFEGHYGFNHLAHKDDREPCYDAKWRNAIAKLELRIIRVIERTKRRHAPDSVKRYLHGKGIPW